MKLVYEGMNMRRGYIFTGVIIFSLILILLVRSFEREKICKEMCEMFGYVKCRVKNGHFALNCYCLVLKNNDYECESLEDIRKESALGLIK